MNDFPDYIDNYFHGRMNPAEKNDFEIRCLSDPAFARMVAFYISLHDQLFEQWAEQKKKEFAQWEKEADLSADLAAFSKNGEPDIDAPFFHEEMELPPIGSDWKNAEPGSFHSKEEAVKKEKNAKIIKLWIKLSVAAAVLVVLALGITRYVQSNKDDAAVAYKHKEDGTKKEPPAPGGADTTSPHAKIISDTTTHQTNSDKLDKAGRQHLFAMNFEPDAPPGESPEFLEEALKQYKNGRYKNSSRSFEKAIDEVQNLTPRMLENKKAEAKKKRILFYARYYNGLSYLAGGNTAKAISELKAIRHFPDGYSACKVQWYLALAYLETGDVKRAKVLLDGLAGNKQAREYRQKALNLSNHLKG